MEHLTLTSVTEKVNSTFKWKWSLWLRTANPGDLSKATGME